MQIRGTLGHQSCSRMLAHGYEPFLLAFWCLGVQSNSLTAKGIDAQSLFNCFTGKPHLLIDVGTFVCLF